MTVPPSNMKKSGAEKNKSSKADPLLDDILGSGTQTKDCPPVPSAKMKDNLQLEALKSKLKRRQLEERDGERKRQKQTDEPLSSSSSSSEHLLFPEFMSLTDEKGNEHSFEDYVIKEVTSKEFEAELSSKRDDEPKFYEKEIRWITSHKENKHIKEKFQGAILEDAASRLNRPISILQYPEMSKRALKKKWTKEMEKKVLEYKNKVNNWESRSRKKLQRTHQKHKYQLLQNQMEQQEQGYERKIQQMQREIECLKKAKENLEYDNAEMRRRVEHLEESNALKIFPESNLEKMNPLAFADNDMLLNSLFYKENGDPLDNCDELVTYLQPSTSTEI